MMGDDGWGVVKKWTMLGKSYKWLAKHLAEVGD
jgi:hypothetical protein